MSIKVGGKWSKAKRAVFPHKQATFVKNMHRIITYVDPISIVIQSGHAL